MIARPRPHPRPIALAATVAVVGAVLGRAVADPPSPALSETEFTGLAVATIAVVVIIASGATPCLAAMAVLAVVGWLPRIAEIATAQVTLFDVLYVGLVGWYLVGASSPWSRAHRRAAAPVGLGYGPVIAFLAFVGVMTLSVAVTAPAGFTEALVSWLRLAQTASLAWLAAAVLRTVAHVQALIWAVAVGVMIALGFAVAQSAIEGGSLAEGRFGGLGWLGTGAGVNSFGLASAVLLVLAAFGGVGARRRDRALLAIAGIMGLALAKSVGSLAGAAIALAVGVAWSGVLEQRRAGVERAARLLVLLVAAIVIALSATQILRPSSSPFSTEFGQGSVYHRLIVATAGLEAWRQNPLVGVGWRQSDRAISSPSIAAELRRRFPAAPSRLMPDVTPTSVHNAYVQVLAELGLIGFVLLIAACASLARNVVRLLSRLPQGSEAHRVGRALALPLILVLAWLNENPLYGGQAETILVALFAGAIVALARTSAERTGAAAA